MSGNSITITFISLYHKPKGVVNMFGDYIREKRMERGLSLAELARSSGHSVSTLHGIENGDNQNPRFRIIIDLCKALDISLDEMRNAFDNK